MPAIMPNKSQPMDFAQRNHRKQTAVNAYPQLWRRMIRDWQSDQQENALWMLYAASYLVRSAGVRWALDPFSLFTRAGGASSLDYRADLAPLDLVLLSHWHADHFDTHLLTELSASPLTWVVPEFMLEMVTTLFPLDADRVIIGRGGQPIQFKTMTITPFNALHIRGKSGVPELGYLVEYPGGRWLFPGDTRNYDFSLLPDFGPLDGVFAHLWLGKGAALESEPLFLEEFCRFFTAFDAQVTFIAHMYEYGRDEKNMWTMEHFRMAQKLMKKLAPGMGINPALTGEKIIL